MIYKLNLMLFRRSPFLQSKNYLNIFKESLMALTKLVYIYFCECSKKLCII